MLSRPLPRLMRQAKCRLLAPIAASLAHGRVFALPKRSISGYSFMNELPKESQIHPLLDRTTVDGLVIFDRNIYTVKSHHKVISAIEIMAEANIGSVVVLEDNQVVGVLTERDVIKKIPLMGRESNATFCKEIMTPNPRCVTPQTTVQTCLEIMGNKRFRHLPVVAYMGPGGKDARFLNARKDLLGMVSVKDMLAILAEISRDKMLPVLQVNVSQLLGLRNSIYSFVLDTTGPQERVEPDDTVLTAIDRMDKSMMGAISVVEDGQLIGVVTERDYMRKMIIMGRRSASTTVREIMTPQPMVIRGDTSFEEALNLFAAKQYRHMPVVDNTGRFVDILSVKDLLTGFMNADSLELPKDIPLRNELANRPANEVSTKHRLGAKRVEQMHKYAVGEPSGPIIEQ